MALLVLAGPTQTSHHPDIIHPPLSAQPAGPNRREPIHLLLNRSKSPNQIKQIHARIIRSGRTDPSLSAALVRLYSAHRRLDLATRAFLTHFPTHPPTLAWNLLIRAHTSNSSPLRAVLLYNRMLLYRAPPDKFTFPFAIKACADLRSLAKGKEIHAFAVKSGFYNDPFLHNNLIHFYFSCGCSDCARKVFDRMRVRTVVSWTSLLSGLIESGRLDEAQRVFDLMPVRNVVSWTAMIDGCARNGRPEEALELFRRMLDCKVRPNEFTLVALLIACTELGSLSLGRRIHEFAARVDTGVYVGTTLIDMYSKCGSLEDAVRVFDKMPVRSLATWNSMITSFGVHGYGRKAVELFARMEEERVEPDGITLVGILCACAGEGMVEEGFRLFKYISEKFKIEPGLVHYRCLLQLLDSEGRVYMVEKFVMTLSVEQLRMLLVVCQDEGTRNLEDTISRCISCIVELEDSQDYWEVG